MPEVKDKRITVKVTSDLHTSFKEYCNSLNTDVSDELRRYMQKCVDNHKKKITKQQ